MPECEICGKKVDTVYEIMLDGAQMLVCEKDARGRHVAHSFGSDSQRAVGDQRAAHGERAQEELIENYGEAIRKAREALGLPVRVLGERISEKESTLSRIEKQETLPSEKTRKKLEKELGIKLLAKEPDEKRFVQTRKNEPATLWEFANKKDEKEENDGE